MQFARDIYVNDVLISWGSQVITQQWISMFLVLEELQIFLRRTGQLQWKSVWPHGEPWWSRNRRSVSCPTSWWPTADCGVCSGQPGLPCQCPLWRGSSALSVSICSWRPATSSTTSSSSDSSLHQSSIQPPSRPVSPCTTTVPTHLCNPWATLCSPSQHNTSLSAAYKQYQTSFLRFTPGKSLN